MTFLLFEKIIELYVKQLKAYPSHLNLPPKRTGSSFSGVDPERRMNIFAWDQFCHFQDSYEAWQK